MKTPRVAVPTFSLLNMNKVNARLAIRIVSPTGDAIELTVGPMISRRNRDELIPERQYELINAYLDYKGDEFKKILYKRIVDADNAVGETSFHKGISNPPIGAIHSILDMFVMSDVEHFVRDIFKIAPPENLKPEFNTQIESDGLGTRIQTYIQQDYYELAALTIPIKAVVGVLGQYAIRKESCIAAVHKEYVLYNMLATHPIAKYASVLKLKDWAGVLIALMVNTTDTAAITVIEKQIPSSELSNYILAVVIIQKLSIAAIVTDNRERNVITRIYNYIINKLKTNGSPSTKIRDKKPLSDTDSSVGDKESMVESYRVVSNVTIGTEVELNWYTGNMDLLIRDMGVSVNMALLEDIHRHNQCFKTVPIAKEQVVLAGYIFKKILDPRSLEYINIDGIINVISLGFVLLWDSGHREIAMLLNAKPLLSNDTDIDINVTPNIRLDPELKVLLSKYYPYEKQLNKLKTVSVVELTITELTYDIFKHQWLPNVPKQCITEQFGNNPPRMLPPNFKNHLAKLIINIEEDQDDVNKSTE